MIALLRRLKAAHDRMMAAQTVALNLSADLDWSQPD